MRKSGWFFSRLPALSLLAPGFLALAAAHALGLTTTPYSPEVNNRFSAGFPTAPVENTHPDFLGLGLDWSAVGWAGNDPTKGFAFLSPQHYLVARHYGGAPQVRVFSDEEVVSGTQSSVVDLGFGVVFQNETLGDLSLGTLTNPLATTAILPRYAVLDLNNSSTSNTPANYQNLPVLLYGRGPNGTSSPRIGATAIDGVSVSGNNSFFTTPRTSVQLEVGDSGSPAFHAWTNPNGQTELTLLGNHAAINPTSNFINFLGTHQVMDALNAAMNPQGFALRVTGNSSNTWTGTNNTNINRNGNWGVTFLPDLTGTTSDRYVTFNGSSSASKNVTVNTNYNLRGLFFLSTNSTNQGFTFNGNNTLTIGRGGITNYDSSRQTFHAPLALGRPQYWDGGAGGITIQTLNTNGHLLEITGTGVNRITGTVSGNGSLAVSGGILELTAANLYSGRTWVHAGGELRTDNDSGSATGTSEVEVSPGGTLSGTGHLSGPVTIRGRHTPGHSIGLQSFSSGLSYQAGSTIFWELVENTAELSARGSAFDGIDVGGPLVFAGPTSLQLRFDASGSEVSWLAPFWDTHRNGADGWLIWQTDQSPTGLGNLSLAGVSFLDSAGVDLFTLRPMSSFGLATVNNHVYLTYTAGQVIPEPSTFLLLLGALGLMLWRKNAKRPSTRQTG